MAADPQLKQYYDKDAAFIADLADYGLTPKEILILLAIGQQKAPSRQDPSVPADQNETSGQRLVRTGISSPHLMQTFWSGIPYTTQDTFIKELNQKIARMATRIASSTGKTSMDPASGIRLERLGIDLNDLKNAITSGNVQKMLELTKKLAKNKAFAGKVQELVAQYVPKDMALDFAMQYGGPALQEIISKYDINLDRLKDDPIGYAKELGMNIGSGQIKDLQNKVKGLIADKGKELLKENANKYLGEKGGALLDSFGLNGFPSMPSLQDVTALASSATYELSPREIEIAKRVYTNAYYIFKDLWALKDNRALFLDNVYKKLYLIGPSFRLSPKSTSPDLNRLNTANPLYTVSSSDKTTDMDLVNLKGLSPLIISYALAAAMGEKEPFLYSDKMAYAVSRSIGKKLASKRQADQSSAAQSQIEKNVRALESMNRGSATSNADIDFEAKKRQLEAQEKKQRELALLKKQLERAQSSQDTEQGDTFPSLIRKVEFKPVTGKGSNTISRMVVGVGLLGGLGALYYYKFKK